MSVSIDTNSLAQQIKDVTLSAVSTVKDAVVGESASEPATTDDKHRVFIGNLNSETTEDQLKSLFSQAGEVLNVTLSSKRKNRSNGAQASGIAFIEYSTDGEAQKAIETLNGKSLNERELNVAIARPQSQKPPRRQTAAKSGSAQETSQNSIAVPGDIDGTASASTEKKKRTRKPKSSAPSSDDKPTESSTETNGAQPSKTRSPRASREKGPPADGVPSTTTLFVAGLKNKTTDAELKELFSKYNPTSAHVALRPIPRFMIKKLAEKGEQRLSRGFGFVTFADQEAQTAALNAMDGYKAGERELAVKVAVDSPEKNDSTPAAVEAAT
ncbi:Putative uncharacterized protein [Taphrina deformans PYCC 5710]|uniref:RRM domain-containing protein n=1 Tax=Taphrina deformans (strain PYCC 5710 / ATCC 11124 / CBS 356.35 / IMI 108563 / JCM 9778 / NBRC 8474) TaxID=1097556 RepID=R4XE53_TAPDE|nr:Putative uncharacterized protein [Taphrina deformans PYCC 5710]|eukprot:CCG82720.1 Putative uncharacterized protein [Taphrina deformans PYCC 5710]